MSDPNTINDKMIGTQDLIKDVTTANFMTEVIQASTDTPIIVDFWAPGSAACAQLTSQLESLVQAAKGAVKLAKVNLQENPELAGQLQVQAVPTIYAFQNGRPVDGFAGAMPEADLKKFVQKLTGNNEAVAEQLQLANAHLTKGEAQAAVDIFALILRDDPQNPDALGGLIKCYIEVGDIDTAKETLEMLDDELLQQAPIQSAKTALELAEKTDQVGDVSELIAALEANPDDHQKRFDLALALAAKNDREGVVEQLITIMRKNLNWNEGAARTQLLEFFEAWGPTDENTISGRKQLASLLF